MINRLFLLKCRAFVFDTRKPSQVEIYDTEKTVEDETESGVSLEADGD